MAKLRDTIVLTEKVAATDQNAVPYEIQLVVTEEVCDIQKLKTNPETGRTTSRVIRFHRFVWDALVEGYLRDRTPKKVSRK